MLVLDGAAVRAHLTPALARTAVEGAMRGLRDPSTYQPVRTLLDPPGLPGLTLVKPAAAAGAYGLKVMSAFDGRPLQGFVALLDPSSGALVALLDAAAVTELRTAAASAVATDLLALPDATRLGLLGGGLQARGHLQALREVRALDEVRVWSRGGAGAFVAWARDLGVDVVACETAEAVVRHSDVVCTVTTSPVPVLEGSWLDDGTHVNAVGAFRPDQRELDTRAVARATAFVDMRESACAEAGALLIAHEEGAAGPVEELTELTEVLTGAHPGRTSTGEVTLFSSTGLAVQDVAAARAAVDAARAAGAGVEIGLG